jgi:arylsulfatase A
MQKCRNVKLPTQNQRLRQNDLSKIEIEKTKELKKIVNLIISAALLAQLSQAGAQELSPLPNIIVILADDLGYGSVGCYGATKVKTPNMDRLAEEGIRFTDANTPCSVCMPTRYSLLMGEYPWRREIGLLCGPSAMQLPADRPNIATMLQSEGYATGCVGKWHLGFGEEQVDWRNSLIPGPLERGFDYYFGIPVNLNNKPMVYIENHHLIHPEDPLHKNGRDGGEKSRIDYDTVTDLITGKAVSFIEENRDQPFFLYYATHQIHYPHYPAPRFKGTSDAGIYGDYIQDCDWSVGQILETLDRLELSENTLVFFTSDNGALGNTFKPGKNDKTAGKNGEFPSYRNGIYVTNYDELAGADGEFGFYRNAPWGGYKFGPNQGGSRVPFLVRWPGKIKPGSQTGTLISLTDFYATFRELLGKQDDGQGLDSYSFLSHLLPGRTDEASDRDYVVYQAGRTSFIGLRNKEWLLTVGGIPRNMLSYPRPAPAGTKPLGSTLYHLTDDPKEKVNVYDQYPGVAQRLEQILEKEKARTLSTDSGDHE